MAMKPERRKAFEAALDSLKEDELRALEGLTVVRMEHKDIEMIAHAMGEIVRLKMKERGIISSLSFADAVAAESEGLGAKLGRFPKQLKASAKQAAEARA